MGKVLRSDVHLTIGRNQIVVLKAGEPVPKEYASLVTNEKAFVDEVAPDVKVEAKAENPPKVGFTPTDGVYAGLKKKDLVDIAKKRELSIAGSIPVLVARLEEADAKEAEAALETDATPDLDNLDEAALRDLAEQRGVDLDGALTEEEMIALLENEE